MAVLIDRVLQTGEGRLWLQRYGAGPSHAPLFAGCAAMAGISKDEGEASPIWCPSADQYRKFEIIGKVPGEPGLPSTSLRQIMSIRNPLLEWECDFGLQAHFGTCENPLAFNGGWDAVHILQMASFSNRATEDLIALEPGEGAQILTTADVTAERWLKIWQLLFTEVAQAQALQEVVDVVICDVPSCGECGEESEGYNYIYAIAKSSGIGSPGFPAELIYSEDGGLTWADEDIDTLATTEDPDAVACVGDYVVVVSQDDVALHYADKDDLTAWVRVTAGFVQGPNAIFSVMPTLTWIVGQGGYVYFCEDPTAGVEVQDAGDAASDQNLQAVHFLNASEGIAVGDAGTMIHTENAGLTWEAITGLTAAANGLCCWMRNSYVWVVGMSDGRLYYTRDKGASWTEKTFPGSTLGGEVRDIAFAPVEDSPIGYMAWWPNGVGATDGRILRTIDGGYSWYILPEGRSIIPANHGINAIAVCAEPNFVVGVGLADDDDTGFMVKAA